jgi:hypothetical protein
VDKTKAERNKKTAEIGCIKSVKQKGGMDLSAGGGRR